MYKCAGTSLIYDLSTSLLTGCKGSTENILVSDTTLPCLSGSAGVVWVVNEARTASSAVLVLRVQKALFSCKIRRQHVHSEQGRKTSTTGVYPVVMVKPFLNIKHVSEAADCPLVASRESRRAEVDKPNDSP